MSNFDSKINELTNRMKIRVYKPVDRLDDRLSLCGDKVQYDDEGRQFFIIPAHAADYQSKLHPHYEFGEPYIDGEELKKKAGRPAKDAE